MTTVPAVPTVRRVLLVLFSAVLLGLLTTTPAAAHTELVRSTPKDGARLAKAPDDLTLVFDEPVDLADVRVMTPDGDRLPVTRVPGRSSATVRVALPHAAGNTLAVTWSVIDEGDGHASSGKLTFGIGAKDTQTAPDTQDRGGETRAAPAPSPSVRKGLVAARWTGYLSLALFVGGLAFVALLWPRGAGEPRARVLLGLAWTCGLLSTVASLGLQGSYTALGGPRDVLRAATYADVLTTGPGLALAARGLLWVLASVVLAALLQGGARTARSPGWRVGAGAVALGLLRATGMAGHNSEGSEPSWGAVADLVHLLGVSLWIGGLVMLTVAVLPRREPGELAAVVPGYSRLAAVSVTAIVASKPGARLADRGVLRRPAAHLVRASAAAQDGRPRRRAGRRLVQPPVDADASRSRRAAARRRRHRAALRLLGRGGDGARPRRARRDESAGHGRSRPLNSP